MIITLRNFIVCFKNDHQVKDLITLINTLLLIPFYGNDHGLSGTLSIDFNMRNRFRGLITQMIAF